MRSLICNLFLLLLIFSACSDVSKDGISANQNIVSLNYGDTIVFQLNESISQDWLQNQHFSIDGEDYFMMLDNVNKRDLFCFKVVGKKASIVKTISTVAEGPYGIGRLQGFHFVNWDSIFTIDSYGYSMHLIDSTGKSKKKYSLLNEEIGPNSCLPNTSLGFRIFLLDKTLYIPATPDVTPYKVQYKVNNFCIKYDLENESFQYIGVDSPEKYLGGYYGIQYTEPTFTFNHENEFLYNFPLVNHLTLKKNNGEVINIPANSSIIDDDIPSLPNYTQDVLERTRYKLGIDRYVGIEYNAHDKIYYRFFEEKYPEELIPKILNGTAKPTDDLGIRGLLILNQNYDVIGDFALPKGLSAREILKSDKKLFVKNFIKSEEVENEVIYIELLFD